MKVIKGLFPDERFKGLCSYCGGTPQTRDHTPSKGLLDAPYPDNLPVVPACYECNNGFSIDEEYAACFLDCVLNGSTSVESSLSDKTKRAFKNSPGLQKKIELSKREGENGLLWQLDVERFRRVLLKLARGHAVFENTEQQLEAPVVVNFIPFFSMSDEDRTDYELKWKTVALLPEVGSRSFIKRIDDGNWGWQIVQPGTYRYNVFYTDSGLAIQIVLKEYLACEVVWD